MVLKKENFTSMEDFIEKMTPIMKKSVWDFSAKTPKCKREGLSPDRLEEFHQIGMLSLVELYHKLMAGVNITTGRVYCDVFHDLYSFITSEFHVAIPRYMYGKKHNDYIAADISDVKEAYSHEHDGQHEDMEFGVDADLFRSKLRKEERIVFDCLTKGISKQMIASRFLHTSGANVTRIVQRVREKYDGFFDHSSVGVVSANG